MRTAIELANVYRSFGGRDVLRGLSLSVQRGEVYALLGRNGSGKTTALRILLGFLEAHRGTSSIGEVPSASLSAADRARIGYVSEGHRLEPFLKVPNTLRFERATRPGFRLAWAERWIERCGIPKNLRTLQLSRGQRAQLAVIVAVSARPDVLVFDDPALGLDPVMRRELLDVVIELLADEGSTVLFSSHALADVERLADRVGILHDGRLVLDAPLVDLKRRLERRVWTPSREPVGPPEVEGLIRASRRRDGYELTLLDVDDGRLEALRARGGVLSERIALTLEEVFVDLTARDSAAESRVNPEAMCEASS